MESKQRQFRRNLKCSKECEICDIDKGLTSEYRQGFGVPLSRDKQLLEVLRYTDAKLVSVVAATPAHIPRATSTRGLSAAVRQRRVEAKLFPHRDEQGTGDPLLHF